MKKNAILGTLIGVLIGLSVATYAQNVYNYSIRGTVQIPQTVDVTLTGFTENYLGELELESILMKDNTGQARFGITNTGSADLEIAYTATTDTPQLTAKLEGYKAHSSEGDQFATTNTIILERGVFMDCLLVITDSGAEVGDHSYELNIQIQTTP